MHRSDKSSRSPRRGGPGPRNDRSHFFLAVGLAGVALLGGALILMLRSPSRPQHSPAAPAPDRFAAVPSDTASPLSNAVAVADLAAFPASLNGPPEGGDIDKASEHQNRGTELLSHGKISEARAEYEKAVQLNPEDEDAHYNLAIALARQGSNAAAITQYEEALRIYPDYAEAHINLGNLLVKEGKLDDAIGHFEEALKNSPESASAHNNLGNALARRGKMDEALTHFQEAVRLKPDYLEAHFNLANASLAQHKFPEAATQFREVLRLNPEFKPARAALQRIQQVTNAPAQPE